MTDNRSRPECFVFNSPVLVPWTIVEPLLDKSEDVLREAILSWDECKREGYKFKENQPVADINYPYQKLIVRRILREKVKDDSGEHKTRMIGIECYFWVDVSTDNIMKFLINGSFIKQVPGTYKITENQIQ